MGKKQAIQPSARSIICSPEQKRERRRRTVADDAFE
jgi:hypothetical protein